jgi:cytidylate kinase
VVIAIDGPAGAGKSTVARTVAEVLGFAYLDSGAMYRAIALAALRGAPAPLEAEVQLGERVLLDGEDVTGAIRTPQVSGMASRMAADPEVRRGLVDRQRALMADGDHVAEGRDIGSVVAPHAELKVFLTASAEERAGRRARELGGDPGDVLRDLRERDERDASRATSPLTAAPDAVVLDTTDLTVAEVVDRIVALARECRPAQPGTPR